MLDEVSPGRRRNMQGIRSRDTLPELAVRRALHRLGYRFRVNARPIAELRRTADIIFTKVRISVFIDGCFWHGCQQHYHEPTKNADYWRPKILRNVERDLDTADRLRAEGWEVLRFWEHQPPDDVVAEIVQRVTERRAKPIRKEDD